MDVARVRPTPASCVRRTDVFRVRPPTVCLVVAGVAAVATVLPVPAIGLRTAERSYFGVSTVTDVFTWSAVSSSSARTSITGGTASFAYGSILALTDSIARSTLAVMAPACTSAPANATVYATNFDVSSVKATSIDGSSALVKAPDTSNTFTCVALVSTSRNSAVGVSA